MHVNTFVCTYVLGTLKNILNTHTQGEEGRERGRERRYAHSHSIQTHTLTIVGETQKVIT